MASSTAPLRLLIAHEQHLQPMGCDVRLLGIIRSLLAAGLEVSLFFRSHTPVAKRSRSVLVGLGKWRLCQPRR